MKRNAFGQLGTGCAATYHRPFLRYFAPVDGEGGGGNGGEGEGAGSGDSEFKPPASQEELDRIIADRVARASRSAREDERRKIASAAKPEGQSGDGAAKTDDKPNSGVSPDDVDKRINDALAAERLELALERVNDGLDKALEGRTYAASKLFNLDRKQFVKEDGKTVDTAALTKWVEDNSKAAEQSDSKRRAPLRGQGERDGNATGGSVQSGRDLYESEHKKQRKES